MKKFLTFVLVLAMVLSVSSVAYAVDVADAAAFITAAAGTEDITLTANVEFSSDATIVLNCDVNVQAYTITIAKGATVSIDLNGHTISGKSNVWGHGMIQNKGTLVVADAVGSGKISYEFNGTADTSFGKGNYTVVNSGTMTVNGGTIENVSTVASHMMDAIDNNSTTGDAILTINSGATIRCPQYIAIRQYANSDSYANSVTVNGGTVTGGKRAIWVHLPGSSAASKKQASLTVIGGTLTSEDTTNNHAIYVYSYGDSVENLSMNISGGTINGDVALYGKNGLQDLKEENMSVTGGDFNGAYGIYDYSGYGTGYENQEIPFEFVSGGTFDGIWDEELIDSDALVAKVTDGTDTVYAIGKNAIEEAAEKAAEESGAENVTVTVTQGSMAFDEDDLPGGATVKNDGTGDVTVGGEEPDPSHGLVVPTPAPQVTNKPTSTGNGISVKYNGGNSFSTSNPSVPTGVEIDGVPVTFNGTGSNFSVGCISSDAKWVTVRWNSTSVTTNFTPDGLVECTTVSIPKTGDMSFWAAVAAFFGF